MSFTLVDPETTHIGDLYSDRAIHGNNKGGTDTIIRLITPVVMMI